MDYTAILILACIFIPLERLIPLHEGQKITRKDWLNDVFFVLFNGFFVRFGSGSWSVPMLLPGLHIVAPGGLSRQGS